MSVFLDTGWFFAFYNRMDARHDRATDIAKRVVNGEFGAAYTSDFIFDECVTLMLARTGRPDEAINMGRMLLGERTGPFAVILRVSEDVFKSAWTSFQSYARRGLSFTDCTSVALMKAEGIRTLASFDSSFDGIVDRIR